MNDSDDICASQMVGSCLLDSAFGLFLGVCVRVVPGVHCEFAINSPANVCGRGRPCARGRQWCHILLVADQRAEGQR
jgi:hypothetical protein